MRINGDVALLKGIMKEILAREENQPGRVLDRDFIEFYTEGFAELKEALGTMIRTREPIPFDAPDGQPVRLIFVLLVPERATDIHLQILSELAQMFSDQQFRNRLLACEDGASIHQLFYDWSGAT